MSSPCAFQRRRGRLRFGNVRSRPPPPTESTSRLGRVNRPVSRRDRVERLNAVYGTQAKPTMAGTKKSILWSPKTPFTNPSRTPFKKRRVQGREGNVDRGHRAVKVHSIEKTQDEAKDRLFTSPQCMSALTPNSSSLLRSKRIGLSTPVLCTRLGDLSCDSDYSNTSTPTPPKVAKPTNGGGGQLRFALRSRSPQDCALGGVGTSVWGRIRYLLSEAQRLLETARPEDVK